MKQNYWPKGYIYNMYWFSKICTQVQNQPLAKWWSKFPWYPLSQFFAIIFPIMVNKKNSRHERAINAWSFFFFNTCEGNSYCPSLIWLFYPLFVPLLFLISLSLYLLGLILLTLHILFILRLIYNERSPNFSTQIEFSHVNISLANTFYLFIF